MDAATIASLATAGGTLVLAVATFSSTRSANRASRIAERSFQVGLRPVLFNARPGDDDQKVGFSDDHWLHLRSGLGAIDVTDAAIFMAFPLRNVASGIAVLHGWHMSAQRLLSRDLPAAPDEFRVLTRDLYIPAGELGFWQGALRDPSDPLFAAVAEGVVELNTMTVDLLYGDHEGGQRTISRFALAPRRGRDGDEVVGWSAPVVRHWRIDGPDPR